jgi:hypothetical protein
MKRTTRKQRRYPPFPAEYLFLHPAVIALPAAGYGILCRLLFHFWQTDCRPMPVADHELCGIGRAHRPTWRHHKDEVLSIFRELEPDLVKYRENWLTARGGLIKAARTAAALTNEKRRRARQESGGDLSALATSPAVAATPPRIRVQQRMTNIEAKGRLANPEAMREGR